MFSKYPVSADDGVCAVVSGPRKLYCSPTPGGHCFTFTVIWGGFHAVHLYTLPTVSPEVDVSSELTCLRGNSSIFFVFL